MGRKKGKGRRVVEHSSSYDFTQEFKDTMRPIFQKMFSYSASNKEVWNISQKDFFSEKVWIDPQLMELKTKLNNVKSELSCYEINTWHFHTTAMNQAGDIINYIKTAYGPEMCTQAWCKFHEIICNFQLIDLEGSRQLKTFHLCEAPGAFITSLNHYIKSRSQQTEWEWRANTLNPHYEGNKHGDMIADDQFIVNTMGHWYFGADNTGNVMNIKNLSALTENLKPADKFDLVTADGSIDCANNPAEQESIVSHLHYCELVTGLAVLKPGGHMVIKMFTLLEESSISMLYIMCCAFAQVTVCKPSTSKPGNSEVYVVCQNYYGVTSNVMDKLINNFGRDKSDMAILPQNAFPEQFLLQHRECCNKFTKYQVDTIQLNRRTFEVKLNEQESEKLSKEKQCIVEIRHGRIYYFSITSITLTPCLVEMFEQLCQMKRIPNNEKIVPFRSSGGQLSYVSGKTKWYTSRKPHQGSYIERQQNKQLQWTDKVKMMKIFDVDNSATHPVVLKSVDSEDTFDDFEWNIVEGKCIEKVWSSRYCNAKLLKLYNEFLEHVDLEHAESSKMERFSCLQEDFVITMKQHFLSSQLNVQGEEGDLLKHIINVLTQNGLSVHVNISSSEETPVLYVVEMMDEIKQNVGLLSNCHMLKCMKTLQALKPGDSIIVQHGMALTRTAAGFIYLLQFLFESVQIFWSCKKDGPWFYLLGLKFIKKNSWAYETENRCRGTNVGMILDDTSHENGDHFQGNMVRYNDSIDNKQYERIKQACDICERLMSESCDKQIVEFVPMGCFYESSFYDKLCWLNDQCIKCQINYYIEHVRKNMPEEST